MVPRGLRIRKRPTTIYSEVFTSEWNKILTKCSLSVMDLIVKYETDNVKNLQQEIKEAKVLVDKQMGNKEYEFFNTKILKNVESLERGVNLNEIMRAMKKIISFINNTGKYTGDTIETNKTIQSTQRIKGYAFHAIGHFLRQLTSLRG